MSYQKEIVTAIRQRRDDNSTESEELLDVTNAINFGDVSSKIKDDYVTYRIITSQHEQTFTSYIENSLVQFDVFSTSEGNCLNIMGKLEAVYDDADLSINKYEQIECTRENENFVGREDDTGLYHYYVEYDINVETNK